jgi:beta-glucosidase/6-phospho-beta-glucosidase/beta-galactosidase/ABC-type amino acid transport substrate-binding protein
VVVSLADRARGIPPPRLDDAFLFGVATADHQCEAYEEASPDVRDVWETAYRLQGRERATDFWGRFRDDVELARKLGCRAFRFSVAWSRVEPIPGQFCQEALDHYREVVAAIVAAGMLPILTLHHFTWPLHVEQRGGLVAREFPRWFEAYAARVAAHVGQDVPYWITFNEPSQLIYGYVKPWWEERYAAPPGLRPDATLRDQVHALRRLIRNLFIAHSLARRAIKSVNSAARVGANPLLLGLPGWLQRWVDARTTRLRTYRDLMVQGLELTERRFPERGRADITLATLTATTERAQAVAFSDVYLVAGQKLLVRAASPHVTPPDLAGRTVAFVTSTTAERSVYEHMLRGALPAVTLVPTQSDHAALEALASGRADAVLGDDLVLLALTAPHPGEYRLLPDLLTSEPYAAGVPHGDRALLSAVNAAIGRFKELGEWAASYRRHFGEPPPPVPGPLRLARAAEQQWAHDALGRDGPSAGLPPEGPPGTALRRIQDRGYLAVAITTDVPGIGRYDESTGQYEGFEVDLARAIAREILGDPSRVRFEPVANKDRIPILRSIPALVGRLLTPLLRQYSILLTLFVSNWWHLGMAGKLPRFLCPASCHGDQDFVGFDYYWGVDTLRLFRLGRMLDAATTGHFERAPVWPRGLYNLLRYHREMFADADPEILVVENGSVATADGVDRARYLREHVRQVQEAVRDGVKVRGYVWWSITSNREWGHQFHDGNDFGLCRIDLDTDPTLARRETAAALAYGDVIARGGV